MKTTIHPQDLPLLHQLNNTLQTLRLAADPTPTQPTNQTSPTATPPNPNLKGAHWRQQITKLHHDIQKTINHYDPTNPQPNHPDTRPRCRHTTCPGQNRRLPHGSTHCPYCGNPLPTAKLDRKTTKKNPPKNPNKTTKTLDTPTKNH